jgi:L-alanine-DL-glutamate epimerase-like enolase superfamily enzyme
MQEVERSFQTLTGHEPYDIAWFEEPVSPDDHAGQAEVRRSTIRGRFSGWPL